MLPVSVLNKLHLLNNNYYINFFDTNNIVSKQKEAEMAMWKRRSKYDPMKAAAEDRRKKEEAKRLAQAQQLGVVGMPSER